MNLLYRAINRLAGKGAIDDGARELASEFAAMLEQAGIPVRLFDGESDAGFGFVMLCDARYDETLCAVAGTPERKAGYLVIPAPDHQEAAKAGQDMRHAHAWPGTGAFAGQPPLDATLDILAECGLYRSEEAG